MDNFTEGARAVCHNRHDWCQECLESAVQTAIRNISDDACMPPRCCGDPVLSVDGSNNLLQHEQVLRLLNPALCAS